jgi:hypothetical protein
MSAVPPLQISQLPKKKLSALVEKARSLGMTPQRYVQQLIGDDLALDERSRTESFAEIMGPWQPVDEAELDQLVGRARTRHHRRVTRGKR